MRLTVYTDYSLRVLIYLALAWRGGRLATIPEIAAAYGISRHHLMKIVHDLGRAGFVQTVQGRGGGLRLARPPESVRVGDVVRQCEPDFGLVECHREGEHTQCVVWPVCRLEAGFHRALEAFMRELDAISLADAVRPASTARTLLQLPSGARRVIPVLPAAAVPAKPPRERKRRANAPRPATA
jgi:Rrf2 family nitric oxide-sensitive transcriptional repressor